MNLWKALGLAGLAGVAAAGVIIAREQRQRTELEPEQIRARLHERFEQVSMTPTATPTAAAVTQDRIRPRWHAWRPAILPRRPRH